jgi:hypothetical protein
LLVAVGSGLNEDGKTDLLRLTVRKVQAS